MSNTGYKPERAKFHDELVQYVWKVLGEWAYNPELLDIDGHMPDMRLTCSPLWWLGHGKVYVDVKTGKPNIAIEVNSFDQYMRIEVEGGKVYVVWGNELDYDRLQVFELDTLNYNCIKGRQHHSGTGSLDDWYLFRPYGGMNFYDYFSRFIRR